MTISHPHAVLAHELWEATARGDVDRLLEIYAGDDGAVIHERAIGDRRGRHLDTDLLVRLRIEQYRIIELDVLVAGHRATDAFWSE